MSDKVEGLLISKVLYGERDLICHLLLRNGRKVSFLFRGGQGGGRKIKSRTLELGYMLKVQLPLRRKEGRMCAAREWSTIWTHTNIRANHRAFFTLCFFLETVEKIAEQDSLSLLEETGADSSLFNLLSNAIFYLDKSSAKDSNFAPQKTVFLIKLLAGQGIFPTLDECAFCGQALGQKVPVQLVAEQGGFACANCSSAVEEEVLTIGGELRYLLALVAQTKYGEIPSLEDTAPEIAPSLFHYFCYQSHLQTKDFKSAGAVL